MKRTSRRIRRSGEAELPGLWDAVGSVEKPVTHEPQPLTVSELGDRIQGVLRQPFERVLVVGEISNFRAHSSGHCYFTLKDKGAQLSAVMFRSAAQRLRFGPSDGLEVRADGRIGFYPVQGKLQLYVETLEPCGLGALRQQLERLREKLSAEGLLDPARKRQLPFLPHSIGLVTAVPSAAMRDVLRMLSERFAERRIIIRPVRVQGVGAEIEIADGLRDLQGIPEVEVVILARGGGSIEDLWAFNDEGLARAIAACRVPVVSAVGHEIDLTIADLVADVRVSTPTAAAEQVLPNRVDLVSDLASHSRRLVAALARANERKRRQVLALGHRLRDPRRDLVLARGRTVELRRRLVGGMLRTAALRKERLGAIRGRLRLANPDRQVVEARSAIARLVNDLSSVTGQRLERSRSQLATVGARLSGVSPLAVLDRGFAVVRRSGEPRALRDAAEVQVGDAIDVQLRTGRLYAQVMGADAEEGGT